jgi:predicted Zn finger-like uncharacterized protein
VKFLCDRCKTRYSIGDERVRGKILKIRCKNCANVITVREGMSADAEASQPAAPEYAGRAKKHTTVAPTALDEASDPAKAIKDLVNDPIRGDRSRSAAPPGGEPPRGEPSPLRGDRLGAAGPGTRGSGAPAAAASPPVAAAKDTARGFGAGKRGAPSDDAGRGQLGAGRRGGLDAQRGEPSNALNAAFASAMAKPPPALEEEWYVSIDGDQAGPFSLSEAQGWVAQKALDAELHCWSEGFDDWLPVDKVSHFRGLRKRPVAAAPPPLPRGVGGPQRVAPAPAPVPVDDDPKPLFAATMASLERGAPVASSPGLAPSARATPSLGIPSRLPPAGKASNGSRVPARDAGREPGAIGDAGRGDNGIHSARGAPTTPLLARPADARRPGAPSPGSPGPSRPAVIGDPFDISSEGGEAKTQIEALPFSDPIIEPMGARPPRASSDQAPSSSDAALTSPHLPASSTLHGTGANPAMTTAAVTAAASDFGGDDDDLAIGEVSRVVKLADIVRAPRNPERSGPVRRAGTATGSGGRATGQNPALRSTGSVAALVPGAIPEGAPDAPAEIDPSMTMAPVRKSHRRGLIALLSVAGVMVLGVVGAVILLVTTNDDPTGGTLGRVRDIDTSRPEDPLTHRPIDPVNPPNPFVPRPPPRPPRPNLNPPVGSNRDPEPPPGSSLRSDEVEDVAHKYQDMTKRCYLRSQRGADAILIGDVKKIAVTLKIDKDGNVGDVQLSEHAADNLGKCLSGSIRGWKFRPSSGGTFRFSLNFVGS